MLRRLFKEKDHRIVSLSLLKSRSENAESGCEANKLSVPSEAWVPSIPPYSLCFGETSRLPADPRTRQLSHFRHVIYATSPSQLLEVRRVSCIFKRVSEHIFRAQLEDFQVHFEEGDSVAHLEDRSTVEMLIDGSAGERIVGVDVLRYSNSDSGCDKLSTPECLGLQVPS